MEEFFESQCNPDLKVTAYHRATPDDGISIVVSPPMSGTTFAFIIVKEDAESMARAILGIPDMPTFDWDAMVAEARVELAGVEKVPA
jgi:hypothetical protein